MKIFQRSFVQLAVLLVILVTTCSFACRNNAEKEASAMEQEIIQTENETIEIEASTAEIESATSKVDSLLNDLDNQ